MASGPFTLRGLTAELAERGIETVPRVVLVFVHDEGAVLKKTVLPDEQTRPDVAERGPGGRLARPHLTRTPGVHRRDLGETNMALLRGWGPKGKRLRAYAPYGHCKTLTFVAAPHDRIDAPWVVDGPINGALFLLYIEKVLAPTLKPGGDIVVLDNLGSQRRRPPA